MSMFFLFSFGFTSLLFSAICKDSQTTILPFFHFFFLAMVLITTSCTMSRTSVHCSSGTLSDLIPGICLSLPLYNSKGFDSGQTLVIFPTFSIRLEFTIRRVFFPLNPVGYTGLLYQIMHVWVFPSLAAGQGGRVVGPQSGLRCPCRHHHYGGCCSRSRQDWT